MFLAFATVIATVLWNNVAAKMPPVEGNCTETFIEIYPPTVMFTGKVMMHTDDFNPSKPDCMTMKLARRASFNSNFRLELSSTLVDATTEIKNDIPLLMTDVAVKARRPLAMLVGDQAANPPTLMITQLDKESECYTAWACVEMQGVSQKSGWVVCKDNYVDSAVIEELLEHLCEETGIAHIKWIEYAVLCTAKSFNSKL